MPRKQRFKPSRKPQNQQVSNPQMDDRKDAPSEGQDVQRQASGDEAPRDIENEQA